MENNLQYIRDGLKSMAKNHAPAVTIIARVKSVNETESTCVLEDEDGQEYLDVRLRPVLTGNNSFIQIPQNNCYAMAIRIEDDEDWMIIACDRIEKIKWTIGDNVFEISDKVQLIAGGISMLELWLDLIDLLKQIKLFTPSGVSGVPVPDSITKILALEAKIRQHLK